jgi:glyoxylase-like metal-dependent hydrolase (beta-lactamase superfamily II)
MNRTPASTFIMRSKSFLRQVLPIALLALGGVLIRTAQVRSQSTNSNSAPAPVEFYHLVQGFLPEVIGPDGSPMMPAFSSPNPWNLDTAYLMSTNAKGQRTWRIENFLPGRGRSQGSSMYLLEGSKLALLIDTAQDTPGDVMGKNDLKTLVQYLLSHNNLGGAKPNPVDFVVANTHNHGDHTGKNSQMSDRKLYYPELDWPTNAAAPSNYVPIKEGGGPGPHGTAAGKIELGDRTIEAIDIHGHTLGSTGYLDRENQMIATGDALGSAYVWAQFGLITTYDKSVHHVQEVLRPSNHLTVMPAHFYQNNSGARSDAPIYGRPIDKPYIDDQVRVADGILNGTVVGKPYAVGRDVVWATIDSGGVCYSLGSIYPPGAATAYNAVKISGATNSSRGAGALSALANIHSDFYLIHDQAAALFLLVGSNKALLFGTGSGRPGLSEFVKKFAGSKPVEVVISSDDSEQIGGLAQFASNKIYLPKGSKIATASLRSTAYVGAGDKIDLGVDSLGKPQLVEVYPLVGHSTAGLTLLDSGDRLLFGGDALGTQGGASDSAGRGRGGAASQANSGGLILKANLADFDKAFSAWRTQTDGKYDVVYTAHNYQWFTAPAYIDQLQSAVRAGLSQEVTTQDVAAAPTGQRVIRSTGAPDVAAAVILEGVGSH